MATRLRATFATRREAEMTVERLVQEQGIARDAITIAAEGGDNSAGEAVGGSDAEAGQPSPEARDDGALNGRVMVTVATDAGSEAKIRAAFAEFDAATPTEA